MKRGQTSFYRFAFFIQKHRQKEARQTDARNVPETFADKEAIRSGTGRSKSEKIIRQSSGDGNTLIAAEAGSGEVHNISSTSKLTQPNPPL